MTQHWSYAASPEFDDRQFGQWRELLERRVGMQLPDQRRSFIQTNLNIRMREVGFSDYQSYYNHVVESAQGIAEWSVLVDRFTVQETRFFRDVASFKLVERYLEKRKQTQKLLNLWSVGCATGEEPQKSHFFHIENHFFLTVAILQVLGTFLLAYCDYIS